MSEDRGFWRTKDGRFVTWGTPRNDGVLFKATEGRIWAEWWTNDGAGNVTEGFFTIDPADLARFLKENFPEVME
jgi:hypothetical protein